MVGKIGQIRLMDRILLRAIGTLALVGGVIFFLDQLPLIGGYLVLAGLTFMAFSIGFRRRYQNVLKSPPDGYEFTGERLFTPPGEESVEVWHRGIARVYVAAARPGE